MFLQKKKQDLQSQMQGILDVLNTMNNHQHELEIISSKTHLFKDKIDQRIKYIQNYNDKVAILSSMFNEKRQNLFGNWKNWTSKQVIIQLKYYLKINEIKLNSLSIIIQQFKSKSIKGSDLKNLNELTFKMMDITDEYDQNVLIMWISHVINNNNDNDKHSKPPPLILSNHHNEDDEDDDDEECKMDLSSGNSPEVVSNNNNNNSLICSICMENTVNIILNCGHLTMCDSCSQKITKRRCPICREDITEIKQIYFAAR
mmetsp:Transcript_6325/g.5557  ORF Transcript_6325/g.5557 Transcript_6325/m.5557 type:complete len:258 (+) Transcript_6325:10-783(+)